MTTAQMTAELAVTEEDLARAAMYGLLARLFYAPPDASLLQAISLADEIVASDPNAALSLAWRKLQAASLVTEPAAVTDEFSALFIGVGHGQVNPYLSWHLTGFMMEEPLAHLRDDLTELGLARATGIGETEDHFAAICEVMRLMTAGESGAAPATIPAQRHFFDDYLRPWYRKFGHHCETAASANYYRAVSQFMQAFLAVEAQAFDMAA